MYLSPRLRVDSGLMPENDNATLSTNVAGATPTGRSTSVIIDR